MNWPVLSSHGLTRRFRRHSAKAVPRRMDYSACKRDSISRKSCFGEGCLAGQSQRMASAIEAGVANRVCGTDEIIGLLATPEREPAV
jgi:hypothetical protein